MSLTMLQGSREKVLTGSEQNRGHSLSGFNLQGSHDLNWAKIVIQLNRSIDSNNSS